MTYMGIAALQLAAASEGNLELFEHETEAVVKRLPWVQMVVGSELVIHGVKKANAEPAGGPTEVKLQALARRLGIWLIPGSLYQEYNGKIYNMAPVIAPSGEIVARYNKMYPFLPYETGVEAGRDYVTFDVPGVGKFGIAICYDMWFPEAMRTLAAMGAEAIILPTMTNTIDRDVELSIARANAAINQCYFIDVNGAGDQANGRSVFYGPGGDLIYQCDTGRDIVALEVDFDQVRRVRSRGWHGLGQVLKSFRDAPTTYPMHSDPARRIEAMANLGSLDTPQQTDGESREETQTGEARRRARLSVAE